MLFPLRDENESRTFPILTSLIIALNVAVYLTTLPVETLKTTVEQYGFTPATLLVRPQVAITSTFLHAGLLHLISNMWFLWIFGDGIEDRFGRIRFLFLYLASGVIGNLTHALLNGFSSDLPVIGASGAVAGIMGSYIVRYPLVRVRSLFLIIFYPVILRIPAIILLGLWMTGECISALVVAPSDHVAHWAHVGGFAFGVLWTWGRKDRYFRAKGWWW